MAKPTVAAQSAAKVPSAKPVVAVAGDKPVKEPKRKPHALIGSKDPNVYPFTAVPADYDHETMQPLKKRDFALDHLFYEFRAEHHDRAAAALRKQAVESKALGGKAAASEAKRLRRMTDKIAELKAKLAAGGVDVEALLAASEEA